MLFSILYLNFLARLKLQISLQVNESEKEKNDSAKEHKLKYRSYQKAESRVQDLQKKLRRSINKSRYRKS